MPPPGMADASEGSDAMSLHVLSLPVELGAVLLSALPLSSLARVRSVCHAFNGWSVRACASLRTIESDAFGVACSRLECGVEWLLDSGCSPTNACFRDETPDRAVLAVLARAGESTLVELELQNCSALTDDALCAIAQRAPNVHSIGCVRCAQLSARCLTTPSAISGLRGLRRLDMTGSSCAMTNGALCSLVDGCSASLEVLILSGCRQLTTDGVQSLGGLPHLTELDLSYCAKVCSLTSIAKGCVALRSLNLTLCTGLGDKGISECTEGLTRLERLNLTGTGTRKPNPLPGPKPNPEPTFNESFNLAIAGL